MDQVISTRLWSFQSRLFVDKLNLEGIATPDWQDLLPSVRLAYEWMANQLSLKTKCETNLPPIWAWAMFDNCVEPNLEAGRQLLSQNELNRGVVLIEFDAPAALTLLSCYEIWNQFLDLAIDLERAPEDLDWLRMFSSATIRNSPTIQAVLPHIEKDWVVCISDV